MPQVSLQDKGNMATSLQGRALMRQFRQLVTWRQRILSRCGEVRSTKLKRGSRYGQGSWSCPLSWLTKLAPGLASTKTTLAGQFEARPQRTGQAAVRQHVPTAPSPAVHYRVSISDSALVTFGSLRNRLTSPSRLTRSLGLSPDADCRTEAKGRLCGMNGLSEKSSTRLLF